MNSEQEKPDIIHALLHFAANREKHTPLTAADLRAWVLGAMHSGGFEETPPEPRTLTERRAEFVYNAARLAAIGAQAPIVPVSWDERESAFKAQFLKVIERQCGEQRSNSPEELHESWMQSYFEMRWVYGERYDREKKVHPDLIPYARLGQLERDKDAVFVALCEIARQWIYDTQSREPEDNSQHD